MKWFKNFGPDLAELEEIKIYRSHIYDGIITSEIWCYDEDDENNRTEEKQIIQNFINQIIEKNECVITGLFCKEYMDDENKKNIESKIDILDKELIKYNQRRQKKNRPGLNYYYLKSFNINNELFKIASWNFCNITIWKKDKFREEIFADEKEIIKEEVNALCKLSVVEEDAISIYISDEVSEYRDNLLNELQNLGYKIIN